MLAEDAGLAIWAQFHDLERPWHGRGEDAVYLEECSQEMQELLVESVPYNDYDRDLSGAVMNFSKLLTQQFVLFGRVYFDLQIGWDDQMEPAAVRGARLSYIDHGSVAKVGPWIAQVVPPATFGGPPDGELVALDPKRIVRFDPPTKWRRAIARVRWGLPLIGRSEHLWMQRSIQGTQKEEFKSVHRSYVTHVARLTSPLGWNARGLFHDEIATFHWALRELRWRRFCIEVRDGILHELADAFARIGALRGESPRLRWRGLPTVRQVEALEARLMSGGCRFNELFDSLRPARSRGEEGTPPDDVAESVVSSPPA